VPRLHPRFAYQEKSRFHHPFLATQDTLSGPSWKSLYDLIDVVSGSLDSLEAADTVAFLGPSFVAYRSIQRLFKQSEISPAVDVVLVDVPLVVGVRTVRNGAVPMRCVFRGLGGEMFDFGRINNVSTVRGRKSKEKVPLQSRRLSLYELAEDVIVGRLPNQLVHNLTRGSRGWRSLQDVYQ